MKTKTFALHFRYRTATNQLETVFEDVQTTSQKDARAIGKRLAQERAQQHGGKYWFMGLDDTTRQRSEVEALKRNTVTPTELKHWRALKSIGLA